MGDAVAKRIWVIDPSINTPENEGIQTILGAWPGRSRIFHPALCEGDGPSPESGYDLDGVVLMGSAISVYDHFDWLERLDQWLAPILTGKIRVPLLGICFGHQLIAARCGGTVGFMTPDRAKRLGVDDTELSGCRLLPGRERLRVVVSHREHVETCPPDFRVVARRRDVAIDGLEHAELPLFSFQFHPEAGAEFANLSGIPVTELDDTPRADSRLLLDAFRLICKK
jgi:GMP synthase-like glutamine amidotransferase